MTTSELTLHVITPFSVITQLMNILEEPILLRFIFVATILARNTLLGTIVICRVAKYQRYHTHSVRLSSLTKQQHIKILHDESLSTSECCQCLSEEGWALAMSVKVP